MSRLNQAALTGLATDVAVPGYNRAQVKTGVVHLGIGAFHRAHQAMYLDALMNRGEALDWGIVGVAAWTMLSLVVHLMRLVQAMASARGGRRLTSWLA